MLLSERSLALHEVVHQMGFGSLDDFALEKVKETLTKEAAASIRRIESFSEKYGIDYTEFCRHFHELQHPLYEREEDSAEWNAELKHLGILMNQIARLD